MAGAILRAVQFLTVRRALLLDAGLSRLALHLDPGLSGLWHHQAIVANPVFVVSFLLEAGRCNDDPQPFQLGFLLSH